VSDRESLPSRARLAECQQVYKDDNHKPEMALAVTDFEALCGFVSHEELVAALEATPELRGIIGEAIASLVASTGARAARAGHRWMLAGRCSPKARRRWQAPRRPSATDAPHAEPRRALL
jgi:Phosphomannose isomerase type I